MDSDAVVDALRHSPLLGVFLTLLAYRIAIAVNRRFHGHPLSNTVLVGALLVIAAMLAFDIGWEDYRHGAGMLQMLLGPATVALAVPLYNAFAKLKRAALALSVTLVAGGLTGIVSGALLAQYFGLPKTLVLSLMPRSVTTPIAMGIAERIGGIPDLSTAFVIVTGVLGAVAVKPLMRLAGTRDDRVAGFATGIAAHGIGTARVVLMSETAGAFAGLAMGLNGLFTAIVIPFLLGWIGRG
ncbi:LrgB family protein [Paludibacterium paludis]|uniref:Membrane protein n=1 Tax=Paludibacterium paludis TaxID=1225769 RepID=A0A918P5P6_9NEIS|nr:LrgB family protein [Paludibacterium paludis]GGY27115.1 membrane protein [Paludibacterium paludis]